MASRIGLSSFACAWAIGMPGCRPPQPLSADGLLLRAAKLGLHLVQIADNLPLHLLSASQRAQLRKQARELGIDIELGTRGISPEQLLTYLDLAVQFDAPILRTVIDTPTHKPNREEILLSLRQVLPAFSAQGVTLAIENHDRFRARALLELVQILDSPAVGICLDTVNSLGALEGPEVVVTTLAPHVVSLHAKDMVIQRCNHNMGFMVEGRPVGQGQLDWPWILQTLAQHGREPNVIIELWPPPEPTLEETIAKEWEWSRQSVAFLKSLGLIS